MISSRRTKLAAFIGLILVFATVILFMRIFQNQERLHWAGLFFILLGEILPVAGFIWLEDAKDRTLGSGLRIGVYSLFFVYGAASVSMALLLLLLEASAGLLATLETVLLLAFGAILLFAAAGSASPGGARGGAKAMASVSFMRGLEAEAEALTKEPANQAYIRQLRQIHEAVKYSDYGSSSGTDGALREKFRELSGVLRETESGRSAGSGGSAGNGESAGASTAGNAGSSAGAETGGVPEKEREVALLTEDILRLLRDRNREIKEKKGGRTDNDKIQ